MNRKVTMATGVVYARKIKDMEGGEVGYTVPWAYNPETKELDDDFSIYSKSGGTAEMKVKKTALGFVVNVLGNYKYRNIS